MSTKQISKKSNKAAVKAMIAAKKNKRSNKRNHASRPSCINITGVGSHYCHLLCDPFRAVSTGVPSFPTFESQVLRCFVRGTATSSSTSDMGFVTVDPYGFLANDSTSSVRASTSAYTGTTIADVATGVVGTSSNSPYNSTQIVNDELMHYRVVAAGLRVRYIGTKLNAGGRAVAWTDLDHTSQIGKNYSDLTANDRCRVEILDGKWHSTTWNPIDASELEYVNYLDASRVMSVIFYPAAASQTVEFEVVVHYELIGKTIRGKETRMADPNVQSIVSAVQHANGHTVGERMHQVGDYLASTVGVIEQGAGIMGTLESGFKAVQSFGTAAKGALTAGKYLLPAAALL